MTSTHLPPTALAPLTQPRSTLGGDATAEARGWRVAERPGSGLFVVAPNGNILFRIDPKMGAIMAWDKREGREVTILVRDLSSVLT